MNQRNCTWVGTLPQVDYEIMNQLQLHIQHVPDLNNLISHVNDHTWHTNLIIFDTQVLWHTHDVNAADVLKLIQVLNKTSGTKSTPVMAAWVQNKDQIKKLTPLVAHGLLGVIPDPHTWSVNHTLCAMRDLLNQTPHWPKSLLSNMKESLPKHPVPKLTARQAQVMHLVTTLGASNKVIARSLKISESTVKVHMGAILKKYGVRNRTQLALCGLNGRL